MPKFLLTLLFTLGLTVNAFAQPQAQPLVHLADFKQIGTFTIPLSMSESTPRGFVGIGPDGASAYYTCHVWYNKLSRMSIPAFGQQSQVIEPCTDVPNLQAINPSDPNSKRIGSAMWWNNKLIATGYSYYDGANTAKASHFTGTSISGLSGPFTLAGKPPGWVAGPMAVIPQEWRSLLGGPMLTGLCCVAVIDRSSYGPTVSMFDPDTLGTTNAPATLLVGYDAAHLTLGAWNSQGALGFNGNTELGKIAFFPGTRTVAFFGIHALNFCYGSGTNDPALHNKPDGQGNVWCYDPGNSTKGTHGYPRHDWAWLYDANDFLAVKQGLKQFWQVVPYEQGPTDAGGQGGFYDPSANRLYTGFGNIKVFTVAVGTPPPPPPADKNATWSTTVTTTAWAPEICPAPVPPAVKGEQTATRTTVYTELTPPVGNGIHTPDSPVVEALRQDCDYQPPPPPPPPQTITLMCSVTSIGSPYADKDAHPMARCDTNGKYLIPKGTQFTITIPKP